MNAHHFKTLVWLRWRLRVNQFRRGGVVNLIFFVFIVVMAIVAAVGLFVSGLLIGALALPEAPPSVRIYVWDGIIVSFLFFWSIGLLTDLQRTESLALDKLLHLPISISGAFLVNYLSSLASLTLVVYVPAMVGLVIGQTFAHGPIMLLGLPMIAAFVLAVTALTYQFQGWLASMMTNPRRRRTVIVVITMCFVMMFQLPQLIHVVRPWEDSIKPMERQTERNKEIARQLEAKEITIQEYSKRMQESTQQTNDETKEAQNQKLEKVQRTASIINLAVPFGWLALGQANLAEGSVLPGLLATLAFALIGAASLWRAYRTTLRLYTGQFSTGERKAPTPIASTDPKSNKPTLLERRIPWVSEQAASVALASVRSLTRAPEAKMALLAPFIMALVFGGILLTSEAVPPPGLRPLIAIAAASVMLLSAIQLTGNQFGYDRGGFRAFVLAPIPRREILVGKNLGVSPFAVGLGFALAIIVGCVFPLRPDHYPAALMQIVSAYLIFCLLANALSILAPMAIASGAMKASDVKIVPVLLQMLFLMLMPLIFVPALLPIGVEALLNELDILRGWPVSLFLSLGVMLMTIFVYRKMITVEGDWLAGREKKVLEVVTSRSE